MYPAGVIAAADCAPISNITLTLTNAVTETRSTSVRLGSANNGPVWGGIPGTGSRPQQLPGNGGGIGNSGGTATGDSKVEVSTSDKPNPLLAVLKEKVLPEKEITQPISGLLYFQMVGGKLKPKDLELHYKGPAGRLSLRFRP